MNLAGQQWHWLYLDYDGEDECADPTVADPKVKGLYIPTSLFTSFPVKRHGASTVEISIPLARMLIVLGWG